MSEEITTICDRIQEFPTCPEPKLRLTHLAMDIVKSMHISVKDLDSKLTKAMETLSAAPSNTPSGDSTRTPSITELQVVAKTAAGMKMVNFATSPHSNSNMASVIQSLDNVKNLLNNNDEDEERTQSTARPPFNFGATPVLFPRPILRDSVSQEATLKNMMDSRSYLLLTLEGKSNLLPVTHETSQIVSSIGTTERIRASIFRYEREGCVLDFRAANGSKRRWNNSNLYTNSELNGERAIDTSLFTPPNEFDWFSKDEMAQIFSSPASCHLFTTLRHSPKSHKKLEELYLNARRKGRPSDNPHDEESIQFLNIAETLTDLTRLKKLVLRGVCDNIMLRSIGESMSKLEYLDISGSQHVTNEGIINLVFKNPVFNSAFYLIPAWMQKNADKMNHITSTLLYFDHSWTSVSSMGRKILQLLPGNYLYRRLMHVTDQDPVGHHIFIRQKPCFESAIPSNAGQAGEFMKKLGEMVGFKGIKHFLNIVESHPWKRCYLTVYPSRRIPQNSISVVEGEKSETFETQKSRASIENGNTVHFGIVTPNHHEKRIQGIVQWDFNGNLSELYTIYPMNMNALANLNNLQLFRGIVYDTWRNEYSILPDLSTIDVFTEPITFISILQFCPNLKNIKVRIRTTSLTDDMFIKAIQTTMSRRCLEEIWIAPGSHIENTVKSNISSATSLKEEESVESVRTLPVNSVDDLKKSLSLSDFPTNELIQLSLESLDMIMGACPKIKKVGDIAVWIKVDEIEFYAYCEELKKRNNRVVVNWGNLNFPMVNEY